LKITYLGSAGWKIVDGVGNNYYFNSQESVDNYSLTTDYEIDYDANATDLNQDFNSHSITTAWYIDSIVTATSQKITFTYTVEQNMSLLNKSEEKYKLTEIYSGSCIPPELNVYTASRQIIYGKIPDKIFFDNGSIEFHKLTGQMLKRPLAILVPIILVILWKRITAVQSSKGLTFITPILMILTTLIKD
jgi:hypothetical protein